MPVKFIHERDLMPPKRFNWRLLLLNLALLVVPVSNGRHASFLAICWWYLQWRACFTLGYEHIFNCYCVSLPVFFLMYCIPKLRGFSLILLSYLTIWNRWYKPLFHRQTSNRFNKEASNFKFQQRRLCIIFLSYFCMALNVLSTYCVHAILGHLQTIVETRDLYVMFSCLLSIFVYGI